jgi:hypothetical protein
MSMKKNDGDLFGALFGTGCALGCGLLFWGGGIAVAVWIAATVWRATM